MSSLRSMRARIAITFSCGIGAAGCSGSASVHMVPWNTKRIPTTEPLIVTVSPQQCYYWLSDDGNIRVAMRHYRGSVLGKGFATEMVMSLVLGPPPANVSRDYRVNRTTVRSRIDGGFSHLRAGSLLGIVGVWDYGKPRFRGRFRFTAKQQSYMVLSGWAGDRRIIFIGEFAAVRNRKAGERILALSEEDNARLPAHEFGRAREVVGPPRTPTTADGRDRGE